MENQPLDLSNYETRKKAGHLSWANEDGVAVLIIKQFDTALKEVGEQRMAFSTHQIGKLRNDNDRKILGFKDEILNIKERIAAQEKEFAFLDLIEADVRKTENEKKK